MPATGCANDSCQHSRRTLQPPSIRHLYKASQPTRLPLQHPDTVGLALAFLPRTDHLNSGGALMSTAILSPDGGGSLHLHKLRRASDFGPGPRAQSPEQRAQAQGQGPRAQRLGPRAQGPGPRAQPRIQGPGAGAGPQRNCSCLPMSRT